MHSIITGSCTAFQPKVTLSAERWLVSKRWHAGAMRRADRSDRTYSSPWPSKVA